METKTKVKWVKFKTAEQREVHGDREVMLGESLSKVDVPNFLCSA